MRLLAVVLALLFSIILRAQEPHRIDGSPFPYSLKPDSVYVVYDNNFSQEEVLIIQTLQGLCSKTTPAIYRDVGTGSSVWINDLIDKEMITPLYTYEDDFEGLLTHFKNIISGYVLCDLHSTSANIAISVCGVINAIPITEEHINLMDSLGLELLYDVRNKDNSWFYNNFSNLINNSLVMYQDTTKDLCLGDYSVFTSSMHFFEDIHSEFVDTVFQNMQDNSILLGWGNDEYQTVSKSSHHSISVLPSDYAYNLSLLTNYEMQLSQKSHEISATKIDSVHTVCFLMSDGDNIQWLLNWFITDNRWFGNENRGEIDIGWTIAPALSELAPTVMNKIYESSANNINGKDYFVAGPSGTGYIYPELYENLDNYTSQLNDYMLKSDLNIVNIIGNEFSDFYLYPFVEKENINAIFYYDFSNYSSHGGEIKFLNSKPIISARYNLWGGFNTTQSLADKINQLPKTPSSAEGYSLIPVHNWSNSVDSIIACANLFTDDIRVVAPDKFVNLITNNLENNLNTDKISFISYPNPTTDILNVEFRENINNIKSIHLYNHIGVKQEISSLQIDGLNENLSHLSINFSELNNGVYFLKLLFVNEKKITVKILNL